MSSAASQENSRWFFRARQEWIAEMIYVYRYIRREHLCRKFGISVPTASADLTYFQQQNPKAITYNTTTKRYEAPT